jgi:hypothetical protein
MRTAVVFILAIVLFALDINVPRVNLLLCYLVLVGVGAFVLFSKAAWLLAALAATLTLVAHVVKTFIYDDSLPLRLLDFRLFNRLMLVLVLLLLAPMILIYFRHIHPGTNDSVNLADSDNSDNFEKLMGWFIPLVWAGLAILLTLTIAVIDLAMPASFNLASLYVLPLLIFARLKSKAVVWCSSAIFLLLICYGYTASPPSPEALEISNLVANRALASLAIVFLAGLLHVQINREEKNLVG